MRGLQPAPAIFRRCFDAVVRIYAPCNAEELARVVRPGGWVITATPGPRHLLELKGLIYDEVRLHELKTEAMPGFRRGSAAAGLPDDPDGK